MKTPAHARYAMSSAATWLSCTASAGLAATVPPMPDEEYSLEGTAAHKLLETCLYKGVHDAELVRQDLSVADIPNYDMLKPDVVEAVQTCLDHVLDLAIQDDKATVRPESRVLFEPAPDKCYGTCDIIVVLPTLKRVHIIDFKAGAGKIVEVEENDQAMGYAVAAITTHNLPRDFQYFLTIVQPRAHHKNGAVRQWPVSMARLDMQADMMFEAIRDGESENPMFAPSPERCRWCAAAAVCKIAEQEGLRPFGITSYKEADTLHLPDIETLDPARLAYLLGAFELLKSLQKSAYARAISLAKSGVYIPGFKLVEAQAMRKYEYDTEMTLQTLRDITENQIPDDVLAPRTPLGITDMEATLKRWARDRVTGRAAKNKASEEISEAFALLTTKQSSGNLSLVPETDKRQAAPVTSGLARIVAPPPSDTTV